MPPPGEQHNKNGSNEYSNSGAPQIRMNQSSYNPKLNHNDNRMFLREAREHEEELLIEQKVRQIETKMDQSQFKKKIKLRMQSESIKMKNDQHAYRVDYVRQVEQQNENKKHKQLESLMKMRKKKIKTQHNEQLNNFLDYQYDKAQKIEQVERRKQMNQIESEKKHDDLQRKIELEKANLDA